MAFEILDNEQVLLVEEIATSSQIATVKQHFGMLKRIVAKCAKTNIAVGEEITIDFQWQKFNSGQYSTDLTNEEDFQVKVGDVQDVLTSAGGVAQLVFSSDEPGEFIIKTINPNVDNAEIKVVVS